MIKLLSKGVTHFLLSKGKIEKSEVDLYNHGSEIIISTIIGFLMVFLTGVLLSSIDSAMIFYILFVVVRSYTGGYHADTHLKCKLVLFFCCVTVVFFTSILEDKYNLIMHTIYVLLFISSVLIYAPIINGNKPMKKEEIERNRLKAIIISVVVCVLSYAMYFFSLRCTISIGITLVTISFLMVIGKLKERRKLVYEKKW